MTAVVMVLGTTSGGTARYAGLLAEGCRRAGLEVMVAGPDSARPALLAGAAGLPPAEGRPAAGKAGGGPAAEKTAGPARDGGRREHDRAGGPAIAFQAVDIADRPRPRQDLAAVRRLRGLLREAAPGVVHAHGMRAGAFAALALLAWPRPGGRGEPGLPGAGRDQRPASHDTTVGQPEGESGLPGGGRARPRRRRPALVVTVHNAPPGGRQARAVYGVLELICARRADRVLCVSADLAARMRRRGARRTDTLPVPAPAAPPPEAGAIARARAEMSPNGLPVVLAVARLAAQKGLDTLLAAAAQWRDRDQVPRLVIAGDGPLAGGLAAMADRAGTDLVLLGQRADVPALLGAADVVVVASRWEGSPLFVQEVLRAGRPLVATRVGGIPALTGEAGALLVPAGDAGALAGAVAAVLDDPALAERLSRDALRQAALLPTPAGAAEVIVAVYRQACAAGNGAGCR